MSSLQWRETLRADAAELELRRVRVSLARLLQLADAWEALAVSQGQDVSTELVCINIRRTIRGIEFAP